MTKEEAILLVDKLEDLVQKIIERDKANDGEFGDGGFADRNVKICKDEIIVELMKINTEVAER